MLVPIPRLPIRALALLLAAVQTSTPPQTATLPVAAKKPRPKADQPLYNPNLILLDPAHGGSDNGAKLTDDVQEKDATLAFANKLKPLLVARGFTVLFTHDDAATEVSLDQRTELANRSRAVACVLIHAANGGHGIHLFTSSLAATPAVDPTEPKTVLPWDTAQATSVPNSLRLSGEFANVLSHFRVPLVVSRISVQPIDAMSCPAIALELAPLVPAGADSDADPTPASDAAYQQRIADAAALALISWRAKIIAETTPAPAPGAATTPKPAVPKATVPPAPKLKSIPIETPDVITPPAAKPAPIVRKSPEPPPTASPAAAPLPPKGPPQ